MFAGVFSHYVRKHNADPRNKLLTLRITSTWMKLEAAYRPSPCRIGRKLDRVC